MAHWQADVHRMSLGKPNEKVRSKISSKIFFSTFQTRPDEVTSRKWKKKNIMTACECGGRGWLNLCSRTLMLCCSICISFSRPFPGTCFTCHGPRHYNERGCRQWQLSRSAHPPRWWEDSPPCFGVRITLWTRTKRGGKVGWKNIIHILLHDEHFQTRIALLRLYIILNTLWLDREWDLFLRSSFFIGENLYD